MSCWRKTEVLRIPASVLGFETRQQWNAFLAEHEDDFDGEPGSFGESLSESYPCIFPWYFSAGFDRPDRRLDQRDPDHPEIVPGPFLDYCLEEIIPLDRDDNTFGQYNMARPLTRVEKKVFLPVFLGLFPRFTLKDMDDVRRCRYEWYDGSNAPYYYSDLD